MNAPPLSVMLACLVAVLSFGCAAARAELPSPYIAEIMADNAGTLRDEDEDTPDWIEIHHRGAAAISLENYALSDDASVPGKWRFPDIVLEPDARLLVFASGKDRRSPLGRLHTNFSLDADGEYLGLRAPNGDIVSELGTYPRQEPDESFGLSAAQRRVAVIDARAPCRWRVPFGRVEDASWTAREFDDSHWFAGNSGIGYDFGLDYHEWIVTEVSFEMASFATSALIRFPFQIEAPEALEGLLLHLRFDDGFVAYLNGVRVADAAAPEVLLVNSRATSDRDPSDAIEELTVDLGEFVDLLVAGTNVLAIHGLDASSTSGDFLVHPRLETVLPVASPAYGILAEASPEAPNGESFAGRVAPVVFGRTARFLDGPVSLELRTATEDATIYYTYDGSRPTPDNGLLYAEPLALDETLAVRARAFREGLLPSRVTTRTYVLVEELASQRLLNQSIVEPQREAVEESLRTALPIVSIAVDPIGMFGDGGLDTIPEQTREIPVSVEYFSSSAPAESFQIDAGLAIHGGNAREHPKKPYRLFFRRQYGAAQLEFPLFEGSPVASFNQLILRAGGHDSWSISQDFGSTNVDLPVHATYLRDQFLRKTEQEMGALSPRGRYVQVILNGFYWGVYDLHERPDATFFRDHLGGKKSDWDVLHHADTTEIDWTVIDGSGADWSALHQRLDAGVDDVADYRALQAQLDLDGLIDALLVRMWSGDYDWAGPLFWEGEEAHFFRNKNWYAGRRSRSEPGFFRFFSWDAEMSMGSHLLFNLFGQSVPQRIVDFDLTRVDDPGTPAGFHGALRFFPDYRRRFGDRVQKHLVEEGGAFTVASAVQRLDRMRDTLDPVMTAESARWGDLHNFQPPFTRENAWRPEVAWLRATFIPRRREILLAQLRDVGLYPRLEAPAMQPLGGSLDSIATIALESDGGTLYYTTDGTDPATPVDFAREVLLDGSTPARYLIPTVENGGSTLAGSWKELEEPAGHEQWIPSRASVGYDTGEDGFYFPHFESDVVALRGMNTSLFLRVPFEVTQAAEVDTLVLRVKYDDGFAAFLNGEPLVSAAAPEELNWSAQAEFQRPDEDAVYYRDYDLSARKGLLRDGANVLSVQVLNGSVASSDLLFAPQLIAIRTGERAVPSPAAVAYSQPLSLAETTILKARVQSAQGEWSALTEALFYPGMWPDGASLRISEIHYHPLATQDWASSAFEFIEIANTNAEAVQLGGLRFSEGIEFTFDPQLLGSGERVLVVNNRAAFLARYGADRESQIVGEYGAGSRLSNGGETLTLVDSAGTVIDRVTYGDEMPWPRSADGGGVSLERRDLAKGAEASNWVPSVEAGGSPGDVRKEMAYALWQETYFGGEGGGEPSADPDGDARANLLEYLGGSDPNQRDAGAFLTITRDSDNGIVLHYRRMVAVTDVKVVIEGTSDLLVWNPQLASVETVPGVDGSLQVRAKLAASANRWYRLRLSLD